MNLRRLVLDTGRRARWASVVEIAAVIDDIAGEDASVEVTGIDAEGEAIEITIEGYHNIDYSALAAAVITDRAAFYAADESVDADRPVVRVHRSS